jgi:hypothetical protein
METLLMVAVVVIALAVITQAGILIGMYLMSRRLTTKAETLMDDSRKLLAPVELITNNMRIVSEDLMEAGKIAHEQALELQALAVETQATIREEIEEVRARVLNTVEEARVIVMRPLREYSAIAAGISEGVRTFFRRRPAEPKVDEERPAA